MHKLFALPLILLLGIALVGCSIGTIKLYPGPELSENKLALIYCYDSSVSMRSVDDMEVKNGMLKKNFALLPGKHVFTVNYYGGVVKKAIIETTLEAGHEYTIKGYPKLFIVIPKNATIVGDGAELTATTEDGTKYRVEYLPYIYDIITEKLAPTTTILSVEYR